MYATSSAQINGWRAGWGLPAGPVAALPITVIAPAIPVEGPVDSFADEVRELIRRSHGIA